MKKILITLAVLGMVSSFLITSSLAWENKIGIGSDYSTGNDNNLAITALGETKRKTEINKFSLSGIYTYSEKDYDKDAERIYIEQEFKQDLDVQFYWFADSSVEYNLEENLERRIILDVGPGFYLYKDKNLEVGLEAGCSYKIEKYDNQILDDDAVPRLAQVLDYDTELFDVKQSISYYPDIENLHNYMIISKLYVDVLIYKGLGVGIKAKDTYYSNPVIDNKKNDLSISSLLTYSF